MCHFNKWHITIYLVALAWEPFLTLLFILHPMPYSLPNPVCSVFKIYTESFLHLHPVSLICTTFIDHMDLWNHILIGIFILTLALLHHCLHGPVWFSENISQTSTFPVRSFQLLSFHLGLAPLLRSVQVSSEETTVPFHTEQHPLFLHLSLLFLLDFYIFRIFLYLMLTLNIYLLIQ